MFKIGDTVSKDDVFAAGWFFESFSDNMKNVKFVNETDTMCVSFNNGNNVGIVEKYVCKGLI